MHRRLGEIAERGEERIGEDTESHGADASNAVAHPTKNEATRCGAEEKSSGDVTHPLANKSVRRKAGRCIGSGETFECGTSNDREETNLKAIEQPAEKSGEQDHPLSAGDGGFGLGSGRVGLECFHACWGLLVITAL